MYTRPTFTLDELRAHIADLESFAAHLAKVSPNGDYERQMLQVAEAYRDELNRRQADEANLPGS